MAFLEKIAEKISEYGLVNHLIPGAIYVAIVEKLNVLRISGEDILTNIIMYYFIGVVIGRIGSLMFGFDCHKENDESQKHVNYQEYYKAEINDEKGKIDTLLTMRNMYRSLLAMSMCLMITYGATFLWNRLPNQGLLRHIFIGLGFLALFVLFYCSFRKQDGYVVERARAINAKKDD